MAKESESKGKQIVSLDDGNVSNEKIKRHPRWTRHENLVLIQAKEVTENSPYKGRKISSAVLGNAAAAAGAGSSSSAAAPGSSLLFDNTEPKWVTISSYCQEQGVNRGPEQCRKRWSNLIGDYRKVKAWEYKLEDKADSYWYMRNDARKQKKLPITFDFHLYKVLHGIDAAAFSPLPLQAIAAAAAVAGAVCDVAAESGNEEGADDDEEEDEEEDDVQETPEYEQTTLEYIPVEEDVKPVNSFCLPNPVSDTPNESSPSFSDWETNERSKRPRLSAGDSRENSSEAQIVRVLEENNRLLSAQLESHNKNSQLERDQRKQNNNDLMSALTKLTDVLSKIAEKIVT